MSSDGRQIRRRIKIWYLAALLFLVGVAVLYAIFTLPNAADYPRVRLASAAFSLFSMLSAVGIVTKKTWVRWSLLLMLLSMYAVFGTTHYATGETPQVVSIVAFVLLPFAAVFFWRVIRKFIFEES